MKKIKTLLLSLELIFIYTISFGQEYISDFSYYPKIEYNAKIVANNKDDYGNSFKKVVIDGFDSKIPFYVIKPNDQKEIKFVILLHGITQSKDDWINPITNYSKKYIKLKDSLLALGYSVIIPDAKYHGERSYEANFRSPWTFFSSEYSKSI